jgi:hypothetical protein
MVGAPRRLVMGVMGSFTLDVETDGDVSGSPYGTITFEDVGAGEVAFIIDLEGILDGAEIETRYEGHKMIYRHRVEKEIRYRVTPFRGD